MRSPSFSGRPALEVRARQILRALPAHSPEISLAERLQHGPLGLAYGLQSAGDIAIALRQLHAQGQTHGNVNAETILLRESSAHLAAGPGGESEQHDVRSFGTVLHQFLNGFTESADRSARSVDKIAASARQLADRCLSADAAPDMRKIVVELRLLAILARQRVATPRIPVSPPLPLPPITPAFDLQPARVLPPSEEACPKCGCHFVYPSQPRTWLEGLRVMFGMRLRRCHRCYHRY